MKKRKKSKCMKIAENHVIPLKEHKSLSYASTSFCPSRNSISGTTRYCRLWNIPGSTSRSSKTAHPWCNSYSTNISACKVWGVGCGEQGPEFKSLGGSFTHIYI